MSFFSPCWLPVCCLSCAPRARPSAVSPVRPRWRRRRPSSPRCRRSPRHRRRRRRRPPLASPLSSPPSSSSSPPSSPVSPPPVAASLPSSLASSHVARTPSSSSADCRQACRHRVVGTLSLPPRRYPVGVRSSSPSPSPRSYLISGKDSSILEAPRSARMKSVLPNALISSEPSAPPPARRAGFRNGRHLSPAVCRLQENPITM